MNTTLSHKLLTSTNLQKTVFDLLDGGESDVPYFWMTHMKAFTCAYVEQFKASPKMKHADLITTLCESSNTDALVLLGDSDAGRFYNDCGDKIVTAIRSAIRIRIADLSMRNNANQKRFTTTHS